MFERRIMLIWKGYRWEMETIRVGTLLENDRPDKVQVTRIENGGGVHYDFSIAGKCGEHLVYVQT